jgi:AcrR family transcriptional regulator
MKTEPQGLRERNRQERLTRIKRAARRLFQSKGYDRTTLPMIGEKAGLGAATLYGYVQDKRDLVWMLFDEDHAAITNQALACMRDEIGFLDQSINGFRFYYQYFARSPRFAECLLREWDFLLSRSKDRPSATVQRHLDRILKTIAIGRARGEITTSASDEDLALAIYHIYQMESRRWMSGSEPDLESGLRALRSMIGIVFNGFGRDAAGIKKRKTGRVAA